LASLKNDQLKKTIQVVEEQNTGLIELMFNRAEHKPPMPPMSLFLTGFISSLLVTSAFLYGFNK